MNKTMLGLGCLAVSWIGLTGPARSADLVALSPQTWDRYAPEGKEADAIYGDFVLANEHVIAVIAHPRPDRNANMTVRGVGGCLIDLTRRDRPNDQISAFYPGAHLREWRFAGIEVEAPEVYDVADLEQVFTRARQVRLRLVAAPREREPDLEIVYALEDGWPGLRVTTTMANRGALPAESEFVDAIRADKTFDRGPEGTSEMLWAFDKHFGQAYGIVPRGRQVMAAPGRESLLRYPDREGKVSLRLAPGESATLARWIIPGADLFEIRRGAAALLGQPVKPIVLEVKETGGGAVEGADVEWEQAGARVAWGRTDAHGKIVVNRPDAGGTIKVSSQPHGSQSVPIKPDSPETLAVELPAAGVVSARIRDERGGVIPCKVQFTGRDGTPTPDFGPSTGDLAVQNLRYSADGQFRQVMAPGKYDVIVSHGPEFDAVFTQIQVERGKESTLEAKLVRSVKTDGWISTDFHSHSSPSGDNTSSQLGRVLNLLCEHIEFAPCTEHNRLSTYDPHLKRLDADRFMATCVGMELTGTPLPLNHQNAFPLVMRPHTQDGGGPTPDADPATQIERLALWDQRSEKLVQVNHPDIGWMFRDRNGDGKADAGFSGMFAHMDVIEVHPPHWIFAETSMEYEGKRENNTIRNWLQLLNRGRRITGVVNTDAHENFHGSGWLRNYVRSPTDDPAAIKTLDVVHAAERGNLIMTNGPFLEVQLTTSGSSDPPRIPGDTCAAPSGHVTLLVRVQCPNWFDVDRVQVFVNGQPHEKLNFTRAAVPDRFGDSTMKFDQAIPLELKQDFHVLVAAIGERSGLGAVMGPQHAKDLPVAVSNPIYVDVDGNGFKPNGDTLGTLPVKGTP